MRVFSLTLLGGMLLAITGCQGCSGGSSSDGGCPLPPFEPLPEPTLSANVALDRRLAITDFNTGSGAIALFYENNRLALFAPKIFHDVDLLGNVLASTPYQGPGGGSAGAHSVTEGGNRRVIVLVGTYLCLVNPDGSVDVASCQVLYENDNKLVPVAWNAGGFAALTVLPSGLVVHARVFDQDLQLLRESDVWTRSSVGDNIGVRGGIASTTSRYVVCGGAPHDWYEPGPDSCASSGVSTFTSSLDSAEIQHRDLLPLNVRAIDPCKASSSGDRAALVYGGACYELDEFGRCDYILFGQNYITIVDDAGTPIVTKPTAMKIGTLDKIIWDGTRFVYFSMPPNEARVWAFDRDGNFVLENVRLPLPIEQEGTTLLNDLAITTVAPNDYVMVYGAYPPSGFETRMVRFSLPAAALRKK